MQSPREQTRATFSGLIGVYRIQNASRSPVIPRRQDTAPAKSLTKKCERTPVRDQLWEPHHRSLHSIRAPRRRKIAIAIVMLLAIAGKSRILLAHSPALEISDRDETPLWALTFRYCSRQTVNANAPNRTYRSSRIRPPDFDWDYPRPIRKSSFLLVLSGLRRLDRQNRLFTCKDSTPCSRREWWAWHYLFCA